MTLQDRIFDGLAERFAQNIYGTYKGELRLALVWRDLEACWPDLVAGNRDVLDVGGGMGQVSCRLAARGHRVTLTEPSEEMLDLARGHWQEAGQTARFEACRWQDLEAARVGPVDLVVCHAVLEWLATPAEAIQALADQVRAGGYLSLLFYNRHATAWTQLMRGHLAMVRSGRLGGMGKTLNPINPQNPDEVIGWVQAAGLEIVLHAGVRCIADHMIRAPRGPDPFGQLLETEHWLSRQDPYRGLARYVHLICRKP